jgi:hypothetical protein
MSNEPTLSMPSDAAEPNESQSIRRIFAADAEGLDPEELREAMKGMAHRPLRVAPPAPNLVAVTVELSKLSLSPGDVLVAKLPGSVPMEVAHTARNELCKLVLDSVRVAVFVGDIELAVITPTRIPASALAEKAYTFGEFVQYGRDKVGEFVGGMPWSFKFHGRPVTHENDSCYLIMDAPGHDLRFTPDQILVVAADGSMSLRARTEQDEQARA